jgi:hypothetical protein
MRNLLISTCTTAADVDQFGIKTPTFRLPEIKLESLFDIPIKEDASLPHNMFIIVSNRGIIKVLLEEISEAEWMSKVHDNEDF